MKPHLLEQIHLQKLDLITELTNMRRLICLLTLDITSFSWLLESKFPVFIGIFLLVILFLGSYVSMCMLLTSSRTLRQFCCYFFINSILKVLYIPMAEFVCVLLSEYSVFSHIFLIGN